MFKKILRLIKNPLFYIKLNYKVIRWIFLSKNNIEKFNAIKWIWKWKRCFILWNGPSIKNYDLSKLKNEDTFVTNRWYFLKDLWLKDINYYVLSDKYLYPHDQENIDTLLQDIKYKFFSQVAKDDYNPSDIIFRYKGLILWEQMKDNFTQFDPNIWMSEGWSVVLDCLNIADFLWYEEIIFLWIDLNYVKWSEHFYKFTKKEEQQSFINFSKVSRAFENARKDLESRNKKILNATKESKLQSLEFIDYNSLF